MRILLINPPYLFEFYQETTIPVGLAYIASYLRRNHEVRIIDLNVEKVTKEGFENILKNFKPDFVGFSVTTPIFSTCTKIANLIKKINKNIRIIFGGPHPTALPEETLLNSCIDYVVIGEGEKTIVELVNVVEKGKTLKKVRGIGYKKDNKVVITKHRPLIKDLDELSFPSFNLFPLSKYTGSGFRNGFYSVTSRGCPYSCIHCAAHLTFGKKIRRRSIKNVIQELKTLKKEYKIRWIKFYDDVFTIDKNYVINLCKEMIKQNLGISWWCNTRVDKVDENLLELMHKAGCEQIAYGIESGTQRILNYMKKGTYVEQADRAIKMSRKIGIIPSGYFMVNFPTETKEEIKATLNMAQKIGVTYFRISMATPYPLTELWERCVKYNLMRDLDNYSKYGYLQNMLITNKEISKKELKKMVKYTNLKMFLRPVWFIDSFKSLLKGLIKTKKIKLPLVNVINYYKNIYHFSSDNTEVFIKRA